MRLIMRPAGKTGVMELAILRMLRKGINPATGANTASL